MADLFDARFGDVLKLMTEFSHHITPEEAKKLKMHPEVLEAMMKTMREHPKFNLVHGLFLKPEAQIARVVELNRDRGWSIASEAFERAAQMIPAWPKGRLIVVSLVPYLPANNDNETCSLERTFHELWEVAASQQPASWRKDGYDEAGYDRLRLLSGALHVPGLRWEVIDLGYQCGAQPWDAVSPEHAPHAGILASVMLHPEWVKRMDGEKTPYVWMPGYELSAPCYVPWKCVPRMFFDRREGMLNLSYSSRTDSLREYAVPTFVSKPIMVWRQAA